MAIVLSLVAVFTLFVTFYVAPQLLLLRREARKEWGCLAVSKALRLDRASVELRLERLRIGGVLSVRQVLTETVCRYGPDTQNSPADELAKWYSSHRVMIISLIFSNPAEVLRTYPDTTGGTPKGES